MNTSSTPVAAAWLATAQQMGTLISRISECLLLLAEKSATVEERTLAGYLARTGSASSLCAAQVLQMISDCKELPDCELLVALHARNVLAEASINQFLKIARFDPNYLEQYFEHDFVAEQLKDVDTHLDLLKQVTNRLQHGDS